VDKAQKNLTNEDQWLSCSREIDGSFWFYIGSIRTPVRTDKPKTTSVILGAFSRKGLVGSENFYMKFSTIKKLMLGQATVSDQTELSDIKSVEEFKLMHL
jgi:hypothetical protein